MTVETNGERRASGWRLLSRWGRVLRISYVRYFAGAGHFLAAAVAFYALICLAPLGILTAAVLQRLLGSGTDAYQVLEQSVANYGGAAAAQIMGYINGMLANPASYMANIVSVVALIWAGRGLFDALQISLTMVWPGRRQRPFLLRSLMSLGMMAVAGLVLALLVLARFSLAAVHGWLLVLPQADLDLLTPLRPLGDHALNFGLSAGAYFVLYKTAPVQRVPWKAAVAGALAAGILWQVLMPPLLYLMTRSLQVNPVYGGLGGVVLFGMWAFLGAQVLVFGAQFAAAYEHVFLQGHPRSDDDTLIFTTRRLLKMSRLPDVTAEAEHLLGELEQRRQSEPAAAAEGVNAVILGGGRVGPWAAEKLGAEFRGLVPVAGHPSVEHVVDALRATPQVRQIVIVGDREAYAHTAAAAQVAGIVGEGPDTAYNLLQAIRLLGEDRRILICQADMPLLTGPALQAFLEQAPADGDLCLATARWVRGLRLVRRHAVFLPLRGGFLALHAPVLVDPRSALGNQELAERFLDRRREILAATAETGPGFMARFFLGWLLPFLRYDVSSVGGLLEAVTGARHCVTAPLDPPEAALMVETPGAVSEAEARLAARGAVGGQRGPEA